MLTHPLCLQGLGTLMLLISVTNLARYQPTSQLAAGRSVAQAQANGQPTGKADQLFAEAIALEEQGSADSYRQAVEKCVMAAKLYHAAGKKPEEALSFHQAGILSRNLGEPQKALDYYNQALALRRAVSDRGGEATTLTNAGTVYAELGELQKALDYYQQALPLRRAVSDRGGEAATLTNIGDVYAALGELARPTRRSTGCR